MGTTTVHTDYRVQVSKLSKEDISFFESNPVLEKNKNDPP